MDTSGKTALHDAAFGGYTKVCAALLNDDVQLAGGDRATEDSGRATEARDRLPGVVRQCVGLLHVPCWPLDARGRLAAR